MLLIAKLLFSLMLAFPHSLPIKHHSDSHTHLPQEALNQLSTIASSKKMLAFIFFCCKLILHIPSLRIHGKVDFFIERPYKTEVKYKIRKLALEEMTEDETHCISHHKEHMRICLNTTKMSFLAERNLMLKSIRTNVWPMTFTLSSYSINQLHFTVTAPKSNVYCGCTHRTK